MALAAALAGGCGDGGSGKRGTRSSTTIPQPRLQRLNERTRLRLAPESRRIDLAAPSFSNPTKITNPLFPISDLHSVVLVGKLAGKSWRAETTLLPGTKTVEWNGQRIEARRSQFVAYLGGRIFEVAVDLYAQADDGSVWYLGENAFTYRRGRVADTEGTWVAGVDGPPALIMPAHPSVGDVYRTENIPGVVFEQVTVAKAGQTVLGPTGPVRGAMIGRELHMDEARLEAKIFAPGYGELHSGAGATFEATALAVPADALAGPEPGGLKTLLAGASSWRAGSSNSNRMNRMSVAWARLKASVPVRLAHELGDALAALDSGGSQAAFRVANACLDLQLRYRPQAEVDLARFELWARRLRLDAAADPVAVVGDAATLKWIRDRISLGGLDAQLRRVESAAEAGKLAAAGTAAHGLERLAQKAARADLLSIP